MGVSIGLPVKLSAFLQLADKKDGDTVTKVIGVYFNSVNDDVAKVMVKAKVSIGDYTHKEWDTPKNLMEQRPGWGWREVIPQNEVLSKLPLDAQGNLPIQVMVTLYNLSGKKGVSVEDLVSQFRIKFHEKMCVDMEKVYQEPGGYSAGIPTMVTVVSKDGKELESISWMLAARSPVFQTMLKTPMTEMQEGKIKMEDIGGDALKVFLHFMHSGILLEDWKEPEILEELTCAAHKYLMQDLLDFLDEVLGLVCTAENCARMIRLAHRLELKKAEAVLMKMRQEQWKQATEPEEIAKLFWE